MPTHSTPIYLYNYIMSISSTPIYLYNYIIVLPIYPYYLYTYPIYVPLYFPHPLLFTSLLTLYTFLSPVAAPYQYPGPSPYAGSPFRGGLGSPFGGGLGKYKTSSDPTSLATPVYLIPIPSTFIYLYTYLIYHFLPHPYPIYLYLPLYVPYLKLSTTFLPHLPPDLAPNTM